MKDLYEREPLHMMECPLQRLAMMGVFAFGHVTGNCNQFYQGMKMEQRHSRFSPIHPSSLLVMGLVSYDYGTSQPGKSFFRFQRVPTPSLRNILRRCNRVY